MSNVDSINCKKRKRCGEKVYKFKTFGEQGCPTEFSNSSFRQNVRALVECGNTETVPWGGMPSWSFQLQVQRNPPSHVLLFVIEEPIELSLNRHCNHCLYVGWGDHIICNKKYHFLVPSKDTLAACLSYEGNNNDIGAGRDRVMGKLNFIMELQGHILHGVFHSNGFGHLLCINGLEMGSDLPGYQVMDFWDRLCTSLQARKVSVNDISQKKTMDLRLLYGIAHSETWFARWGYEFGRGSFGVTKQMHQKAIEAIQSIPLCMLAHHAASNNSHEISSMVSKYQTLSGHSMKSLRDLFQFILELKSRLSKESSIDTCNPGILVDTNCRWSIKRVEMAIRVIIDSLKRAEFRWISRQEVRDAARAYIGDTGLLDFVLKSLGNHVVGNYLVRRCLNPVTKVLEYCLEDISSVNFSHHDQGFSSDDSLSAKARYKISRIQLSKDLFYLYKHIFKQAQNTTTNSGIRATISLASRIVLDSKYLVKEYDRKLPYKFELGLGEKFKLYCTIALTNIGGVEPKKVVAPYECIILGNNATVQELTLEVEKCFKDIYWGLRDFMVQTIVNLNFPKRPDDLVFKVVKAGSELVFEGSIIYKGRNMMYENIFEAQNTNNCVVDCLCGAKEDDGERMVSCDICEVWQHTRCVQIPNNEPIPSIFLCSRCEQEILVIPSIS